MKGNGANRRIAGIDTGRFPADYSSVTEIPGLRITREAVAMLKSRYAFAAQYCAGRRVLEIGCGAGIGLNYLARRARSIVGADYTESLLRCAQQQSQGRSPLVRLDAHHLPFRAGTFDLVILFETIYYLADPAQFVRECRRVLDFGGLLLLCTVNREWSAFNPSPLSKHYFSAAELRHLLNENDFDAELYGSFPARAVRQREQWTEKIRKIAVRLHLIPRTMKGKELLKRLFYGHLETLTPELDDNGMRTAPTAPLSPLGPGADTTKYKVLHAVGRFKTRVAAVDGPPDRASNMIQCD